MHLEVDLSGGMRHALAGRPPCCAGRVNDEGQGHAQAPFNRVSALRPGRPVLPRGGGSVATTSAGARPVKPLSARRAFVALQLGIDVAQLLLEPRPLARAVGLRA